MIDVAKEFLAPKRFGVVSYVCLIIHFLCGLILIPVTSALRASEVGKFSCAVDAKSPAGYRTYVEKTCYSRYEQTYNSPLPLFGFVLLSFGLQVFVSVIYSLVVSSHVDEIADGIANGSEEPSEETSRGCYVFYCYFFHLVVRSVFGILLTVLQHTVFYPSGFDFQFSCSLPTTDVTSQIAKHSSVAQFNVTSIICENSTASEKVLWGIIVSVVNTVFALIILGEVIHVWRRFPMLNCRSYVPLNRGTEFVTVYLLRKRYTQPLTSMECIEFYKQLVLQQRLSPDVNYVSNTSLDDMYTDVVIHTGRAQHKSLKGMGRHEMYDVYTKVPSDTIRLEKIEDLFYPNKDTTGMFPSTILAVGRPGIGKTVLTEKIFRNWANPENTDEFYHGKIAFFLKFRWFNSEKFTEMSLKKFLRHGTGALDEEKFEIVFEHVLRQPEKAIFICDGLDEFNDNAEFMKYLDESRTSRNDPNTSTMSPMALFIKLAFGNMLHGATILATSRPTAEDFYSKLHFERSVEIIGFTFDKIEDHVDKFCKNNDQSYLKSKIWNHIKSSSELLNLCYIPVNSYIVCVTLRGCLNSSRNSTSDLPTTLTALYQTALNYFAKYHDRNVDDSCSKRMLKELQEKAFRGMENGQLVFNEDLFDEQMRTSGLVNCSTNPICPLETQFCFIHLTIQEFLAAKHVIETRAPHEIEKFISTHIERGKWHLVLQFIAGLLGEKIKKSGSDYQDCVLAFAKSLTLPDGVINTKDHGHVFVMKCLREVDDEGIVENVCETSDLSNARSLDSFSEDSLSSSDWAAVTFVCKHLNNLIHLHVDILFTDSCEVCELLEQKCFESLRLYLNWGGTLLRLTRAMTHSKCTLKHEHAKLRQLQIEDYSRHINVSYLCKFIEDGHASHLQVLDLELPFITSQGILALGKVLNDELCGQLTHLRFINLSGDSGVGILCDALIQGHCKINKLVLNGCSLTAKCVHGLSSVLCDEHCKVTDLSLTGNDIRDEGVRTLCTEALGREQCKLTHLSLRRCGLTDQCAPLLRETLQDRNCRLVHLAIWGNKFTEHGVSLLRDCHEFEICKARGLNITWVYESSKMD